MTGMGVLPPPDLDEVGMAAWGRAVRACTEDPDIHRDALERFARTAQLADGIRRAWRDEGSALTIEYSNGMLAPNPLLRMLRDAELDAQRFGLAVGLDATKQGRPGRPSTAVVKPDRKSRITRKSGEGGLRAVQEGDAK